ncbi:MULTISPECIES: ABC transporter permease [Clostridium]|uniref:ABC transporter permease n=1 Tax=Clostridium TaxID=1485 RepID=UPI0008265E7D|nr:MULTISPECIES: ABC transporter permease [Clostridium]PJI07462.1 ABC transporter permease [Clostridium sp. CT7]
MNFFRMVFSNCIRYLKNFKNILVMFILPVILVNSMNVFSNNLVSDDSSYKTAIINLDKGYRANEFIKSLGIRDVYHSKTEALQKLKQYKYYAVYELPQNFSESVNKGVKPTINSYKTKNSNAEAVFESKLELKLNNIIADNISNEKHPNSISIKYNRKIENKSYNSDTFTLLYLMLAFSMILSIDLLRLKKDKVIERLTVTGNSTYSIMLSIYISMFIVQMILYSMAFFVISIVFRHNFSEFGIVILNIGLMSILCIGIEIMLSRMFKTDMLISVVGAMIALMMMFSSGISESSMGTNIIKFKKLNPFYWVIDSVEKSRIFPNAIIIVLMSVVLFTFGGFQYFEFAHREKE